MDIYGLGSKSLWGWWYISDHVHERWHPRANPDKSGESHDGANQKIKEVGESVKDGKIIAGGGVLPEKSFNTPNGIKKSRRPDILVEKSDGSIYGINVLFPPFILK